MCRPTDEQIVDCIKKHNGARTGSIARIVAGSAYWRPFILRRLKRMEAAGLVRRHPTYSYPTDTSWEVVT